MNYQLIRTKRRTLSLEINNKGQLIARAPLIMPLTKIEQFIQTKQHWISNKQHQTAQRRAQQKTYNAGDLHAYLGRQYPLIFANKTSFCGNSIILKSKICAQEELLILYKTAFEKIALPRLDYYAKQLNLTYNQVHLKAQKSLWGSCGANNNINLNYLLIQAPIAVIDCVLVHELCHTKYRDHSPAFYQLIISVMPNYKQQISYLKTNGHKLRHS